MDRRALTAILLLVVVGLALAFRLPGLDRRPMHGDEANQAHRTGVLLERGTYQYDVAEHHGPVLYYATLPIMWVARVARFADTEDWMYRIVPVLFGVGLVFLLFLTRDGLGNGGTVLGALFVAVSPAMVYYSRYYIQEMLLVFFSFGAIAAGWRYTRTGRLSWALACGVSVGLMHATKETCVLAYGAMGVALVLTYGWARLRDGQPSAGLGPVRFWPFVMALVAALLASALFYSSFLTHLEGVLDSVRAYAGYARRGVGDPSAGDAHLHRHAWHFYLGLLAYTRLAPGPWWSEGFALVMAAVGAVMLLSRKAKGRNGAHFGRYLAFYAVTLTLAYALIPYKTPWCMLGFLHPMLLLAGVGMAELYVWARARWIRVVIVGLVGLAFCQYMAQAYRASYVYAADVRNPYVYAHTSPAILRMVERLEEVRQASPEGSDTEVWVVDPGGDYWPIPYYLRRFKRVGYWAEAPSGRALPPVLIISPEVAQGMPEGALSGYHSEHHGLRPSVLRLLFIRSDLWELVMSKRLDGDQNRP